MQRDQAPAHRRGAGACRERSLDVADHARAHKRLAGPGRDRSITTSFSVPPATLRAATPGPRFSQGGPANPPQAKPRTLLQRLLGGDLEAGSYSTGDNSLPLREVAKFKFPVLAMDIAVAPSDKLPHMVGSDGGQIYMYRIVNQKGEPERAQAGGQP